jgi:nicotinamidase/pyrazinamidase
MKANPETALILVDLQNDFCPGGAVPVPGGDEVIAPLNRLAVKVRQEGGMVVASRDWHPENHCSFIDQGGEWPPHCVRDTPGAAFHEHLEPAHIELVVSKADSAEKDAYSAFQDTGLADLMHRRDIREVWVGGLATDYCVKNTVLDALDSGFKVRVIRDAVRAVNRQPGDGEKALDAMRERGARVLPSAAFEEE